MTSSGYVHVWKDKGRKWRWTRIAGNGHKVQESPRHFDSRRNARRSATNSFPGVEVRADSWLKKH